MIRTRGLEKTYFDQKRGEIRAVLPTTIHIQKGEIFGLLGPNGAGKTTLLRMLSTVLKPTGGDGSLNNYDILSQPEQVKKSIGFMSGNTKLYGRLSPKELLFYFGKLYDMKKSAINQKFESIVSLLDLESFVNQPIEKLSTGQTQRTSIARCLFHDPQIYILDEPTLGLDIISSRTILDFIKGEANNGKTIIFSTHYMEEAEHLCSRIGLIYDGKIQEIDTINALKKKTGKSTLTEVFFKCIKLKEGA